MDATCITFISKAALAAGVPEQLGLRRSVEAVKNTRTIGKADMVHNDGTPTIEVDAQTYEVRADGELAHLRAGERAADGATIFSVLMVEIKHKLKIVRGAYKIEIKGASGAAVRDAAEEPLQSEACIG